MSGREQAQSIALLLAAAEALRDPLASDAERQRIADQIDRFVNHKPVEPSLGFYNPYPAPKRPEE